MQAEEAKTTTTKPAVATVTAKRATPTEIKRTTVTEKSNPEETKSKPAPPKKVTPYQRYQEKKKEA